MNEPKNEAGHPALQTQEPAKAAGALTDEERRRYEALRAKAEAEAMAAFDADEDPEGMTFADLRAVNGGDVDGVDAPDPAKDIAHYGRGNIVMFDVPHVRVMKGETDEVLNRMRSSEAENEVMAVIRRFGEKCQPDWFTEWWLAEQKQLVVVAIFEMEDWAVNFKKAMAGAKFCKPRGGKGLRETMLAKYNHAWTKSHEANLAKCRELCDRLAPKFGKRTLGIELPYDAAVKDDGRRRFDALGKKIAEWFPTEKGDVKFAWTVVNHYSRNCLRIAFGGTEADIAALSTKIAVNLGDINGGQFAFADDAVLPQGDAERDDTTASIIATVYSRMEQDEKVAEAKRKSAAKAAEKGEHKPVMGQPVGGKQ